MRKAIVLQSEEEIIKFLQENNENELVFDNDFDFVAISSRGDGERVYVETEKGVTLTSILQAMADALGIHIYIT